MAVLLAGIISAGMMAGCGGTSSSSASQSAGSSEADASGAASTESGAMSAYATAKDNGIDLPELPDNTLKLNVSVAEYQQSSDGTEIQKLWQERMEHYLGCKLDITWQRTDSTDYAAKELVVLQSGNIPDAATVTKGSAVNEYGEDGTLLNLSDYAKDMKYYPDYMKSTNGGEDFAKNKDGSMYYFMDGFYNPDNIEGAQSFTAFAYRFDLLKANNWTPPTTLDGFTTLCQNMKAKIDDGSLPLQYVIINNTKDYAIYRGFVGIFHTWDCLYYNDGKWSFGPIEDNFRECLKYIHNLYAAGYIDPEFATADYNADQTKATTGVGGVCATLWAGSVSGWNAAVTDSSMQWGLAYLPENSQYGTPWKWGSRQSGKSLSSTAGIYISADTEYPDYVVAMTDYQYSDEMVELMNWGIEGETYTKSSDETKTFADSIANSNQPATDVAKYGIMSSSVCRSGLVFNPLDFNAMLAVSSTPEPWWNTTQGYYEGKYWVETDKNGGKDSVSPYDRPPVVYLTADQSAEKAELQYGGVCTNRVTELANQFITGEKDINSDADWNAYIDDVKSQTDENFDDIVKMMNDNTVKN